MKPHLLRMTAFGPYPDTVVVDFDALTDHGLFLLHGPTGAGKTSLLDGLCFALYGTVPGKRGEAKRLRSDHASPERLCEVTLEATIGGRRIRVTRRPEQERPKRRGAGVTRDQAYVALERLSPSGWEPVSHRVGEADKEIAELIGMSVEQFSQVVLLPQGRFAEFLHASSEKRAKLLERLFSTERFRDAESWLAERRRECDRALADHDVELGKAITRVEQCIGVLAPEDEVVERWTTRCLSDLSRELERTETAISAAVENLRATAAARDEARKSFEQSDAYIKARAQLDALQSMESAMLALRLEQQAAIVSNALRAPLRDAEASSSHAADMRAAACSALASAGRYGASETSDLATLGQLHRDALARVAELGMLRPVADDLLRVETDLRSALDQQVGAQLELTTALSRRDQLREGLAGALLEHRRSVEVRRLAAMRSREAAAEAAERAQQLRELRLDGMSAELAAGLVPGQPCPVCGSADHPAPTAFAGPATSKDEESMAVLAAEQAATQSAAEQTALRVSETSLLHLEQDLSALTIEALGQEGPPARPAGDLLSELREIATVLSTVQGHADATDKEVLGLEARASSLRASIAQTLGDFMTLDDALAWNESAIAAFEAASDALRADAEATAALQKTQETVQRLLAAAEIESSQAATAMMRDEGWLSSTEAELSQYATRLAVARSRIVDLGEIPGAVDLEAAELTAQAADDALVALREIRSRLSKQVEDLAALVEPLVGAVEARLPLAEQAELTRELANLAGGTGSNAFKMPLSTYVLAHRLENVAAAASVRLSRMTGGRYTLEHTDDRSGNARAGLGLRVNDSYTGRARDTSTLSGGETFMASLSLALGLAEVVSQESGGRVIEALFVDEGFGTLDEQTLDQVMDVLDALREGGRLVGVVSHVAELRQRIPAQVHVRQSSSGSTLELSIE